MERHQKLQPPSLLYYTTTIKQIENHYETYTTLKCVNNQNETATDPKNNCPSQSTTMLFSKCACTSESATPCEPFHTVDVKRSVVS